MSVGTWERGNGEARAALPTKRLVVGRFEELEVWQTARAVARGVYGTARSQPLAREPILRTQTLLAAISISSNIVEGCERGTRKQQIEFCYIAKGSAGELRSQLALARDAELLKKSAFGWRAGHCDRRARQPSRHIQHLQRSQTRIRGSNYAQAQTKAATTPRLEEPA